MDPRTPSSAPPEKDVVRFGPFELETVSGELRKYGVRVRLQNQPLKLLQILISRPGHLFSREELAGEIWPEGTYVDFERGLNAAVNRLRRALADSAESPRYVETIAGRGYRFIAPVQRPQPHSSEPLDALPETGPAAPKVPHPSLDWRWIAVCAVAVSTGLFLVWLSLRSQGSEASALPQTSIPLTAEPGEEKQPAVSPDGSRVAFTFRERPSSDSDIYVKTIGADGMVRLVSGPAHEFSPAWSPDGRSIAFIRLVPGGPARIVQVPAEGGMERDIAQVILPAFENLPDVGLLAWSPDGQWIATSSARVADEVFGIAAFSLLTGESRRLTQPPSTTFGDFGPSWSPDGNRITFARFVSGTVSDIYVADVLRQPGPVPEARRLTYFNRQSTSPVWYSNGNDILFSCDCSSRQRRFWQISVARGGATAVERFGLGENSVSLSWCPQRKRIVYASATADTNIGRIQLGQGGSAGTVSTLIASTYLDATPDYSPDARYIAYQSERSGRSEIWIANSDGSSSRQLTRLNSRVSGFPRWSPDGRSLVFHSRADGPANVVLADVGTGALQKLTFGAEENVAPSWSRDGRWIYFGSRRSGRDQIWRIPKNGGSPEQVTRTGGVMGFESFDGASFVYSRFESGIWMIDLASRRERLLTGNTEGYSTFFVGQRGVYVLGRSKPDARVLNLIDLKTLKVTRLAEITSQAGLGLSVSPDETSVIYTQRGYSGSDLHVIENFQ